MGGGVSCRYHVSHREVWVVEPIKVRALYSPTPKSSKNLGGIPTPTHLTGAPISAGTGCFRRSPHLRILCCPAQGGCCGIFSFVQAPSDSTHPASTDAPARQPWITFDPPDTSAPTACIIQPAERGLEGWRVARWLLTWPTTAQS